MIHFVQRLIDGVPEAETCSTLFTSTLVSENIEDPEPPHRMSTIHDGLQKFISSNLAVKKLT
jgi:hypothetical protein